MKKLIFTLLALFCSASFTMMAQTGILWEKTADYGNLPAWFSTAHMTRSMAYGTLDGTRALFVTTYNTTAPETSSINVIDAATGADLGALILPSGEEFAKGHFPINTVGFTEDGKLFATSMAGAAANGKFFNVYMYSSLTAAPKLMFSQEIAAPLVRMGDEITVTGKYSDGSAKIYCPNFSYTGTSGLVEMGVLSLVADPNNAGEYVCSLAIENLTIPPRGAVGGSYYSNPKYMPMPDGAFFWKYISDSLYYSSSTVQATFPIGNGWANPVYMGTDDQGRHYFGMMYVTAEKAWAEIWSLNIPKPGAVGGAKLEYKSPTDLGLNAIGNGNLTGDIGFDWTGDHPIIYILACNQGIAAYEATTVSRAGTNLYAENVNVLWERTARDNNLPPFFGTIGGYNTFRITYAKMGGTPLLFTNTSYINWYTDPATDWTGVYYLDATTGQVLGRLPGLPSDFLGKGKWDSQALAASEDGYLFLANCAANSPRSEDVAGGKTFAIYMYADLVNEPSLAVEVPNIPAFTSLGTRMQITGKYEDGTMKIYVPNMYFTGADGANPQTQEIYVFSMRKVLPMLPWSINPTPQIITVTNNCDRVVGGTWDVVSGLGAYNAAAYIPMSESGDTYYWMDSYNGLYYKSPTFIGRVDEDDISDHTNSLTYLGKDEAGSPYFSFITYSTGATRVAKIDDPSVGADIVAVTPLLFDATLNNTNVQGDAGVAYSWDGAHPIIYVVSANMGYGAYEITSVGPKTGIKAPVVAKGSFIAIQQGDILRFKGEEAIKSVVLYNIAGQKIASASGVSQISVGGLKGVYVAKVTGVSGKETVVKTLIK
jgi:hypothetical protein